MIPAEISIGGDGWYERGREPHGDKAPPTLHEVFNSAKEYKNKLIDEVRPAIEKLRDIVLELREELNTKDIGFEVATIAKLRSLGIKSGFTDSTYALITVKDDKFLLSIGSGTRTWLCKDKILNSSATNLHDYSYTNIDFNKTDDIKILKEFVARELGQLTALDQLKKYDVPVGESPRHIFKPSMPKQ
jgi:hypothetical protein